jgi:hypothetical protein
MSPTELAAIKPYIDRITAETRTEQLIWTKINPTTFTWKKTTQGNLEAQLSIQKTSIQTVALQGNPPRPVTQTIDNYIFQAIEFPAASIRVNINTQLDPEARPLLKELFDAISVGADREAINFLKRIFPD